MIPHEALNSVNSLIAGFFRSPSGDIADRLSSRVTVIILSVLSAILISSHYWGEPINCWVPAEFPEGWAKFVDRYCYVHATYYIPMNEQLPWDPNVRRQTQINYYQWVPYVLAVQAMMFYAPRLVWKSICRYFGIDIPLMSYRFAKTWSEIHDNMESFGARLLTVQSLTAPQFIDFLRFYRKEHTPALLPLSYLLSKGLHALNAVLQWYWLNQFLSSKIYPLWGAAILRDLWEGHDWEETGHFPRLTHCDFSRRQPASFQLNTVVCVLTLNLYYEKIFLFLWWWFLAVAVVNIYATLHWLWILALTTNHRKLIDRLLFSVEMDTAFRPTSPRQSNHAENGLKVNPGSPTKPHPSIHIEEEGLDLGPVADQAMRRQQLKAFIDGELGLDGIFVIRMLGVNVGSIPTAYLVKALYHNYHGAFLSQGGHPHSFLGIHHQYAKEFGNMGYKSPRHSAASVARKRSFLQKLAGFREYLDEDVKQV